MKQKYQTGLHYILSILFIPSNHPRAKEGNRIYRMHRKETRK